METNIVLSVVLLIVLIPVIKIIIESAVKILMILASLAMVYGLVFFYNNWASSSGLTDNGLQQEYQQPQPSPDTGMINVDKKENQENKSSGIVLLTGDDGKEYILSQKNGNFLLSRSLNSFKSGKEKIVHYQVLSEKVWDFDAPVKKGRRQLRGKDGSKYSLVYKDKKWFLYKAKNSKQKNLDFEKEPTIKV